MKALKFIAAGAALVALAGCGSATTSTTKTTTTVKQTATISPQQVKQAAITRYCGPTMDSWLAVLGDMTPLTQIDTATQQDFDNFVGDVAMLKVHLTQLRPYLSADDQVTLDGLTPALTQMQSSVQAVSGGDLTGGLQALTGVAPQIGPLRDLLTSTCVSATA